MKTTLLFAVVLTIFLTGCTRETELQRTIFIEDSDAPGLPQYSEWGYNTFGAYFDRLPFVSTHTYVPARFIIDQGATTFQLEGERRESSFGTYGENHMLSFTIPEMDPRDYEDLLALHGITYNLKDIDVFLSIGGIPEAVTVSEGMLKFQRAQHLWVDGKPTQVILSGYFELQGMAGGRAVSIQQGRFDVGIMPGNFFLM